MYHFSPIKDSHPSFNWCCTGSQDWYYGHWWNMVCTEVSSMLTSRLYATLEFSRHANLDLRYLPDNRLGITTHFLLHGVHHYLPMDKLRLVMPPALFVALATPFYKLAHTVFYWDWYAATAVFCGGIFGYICYDLTHYFLHHKTWVFFHTQLYPPSADSFAGSPPFTATSRSTTCNTITKILKTDSASPAAFGTMSLGLSLHPAR